jgi:carbamoyl-phosphate synthase large subunit
MKILVTGVAGDIGLGLGRILREWGLFETLYGIDSSDDHPASLVFDRVDIAPRADTGNYIKWLIGYIQFHKIDVFAPTSEAEILAVSRNIAEFDSVCKVLINDAQLVEQSLDKYLALNFLNSFGIRVPEHGLVDGSSRPSKYPVIVKPRRGQGSKGVRKISKESEFIECTEEHVWQEYLIPDSEEYTCAVYVSKKSGSRVLPLKRVLRGGYTFKATVVENSQISHYLDKIIAAWNVVGLYNIQLRLTKDGPKVFEINPRISGTVVFRDKLGFQDFKWWILELLGMELPNYKKVPAGIKVYKGYAEYIIGGEKIPKGNGIDF